MRFLPVLDIRGGIVVRALGGRRNEYRPLVSRLTDSTEPLAVAKAIRQEFGWSEFYVADLDSITGCGLAADSALIDQFHAAGFHLWLDAGVREPADAEQLAGWGIDRVVCGLETLRDLASWSKIVSRLGAERAVFSLDLRDGQPLCPTSPGVLTIAEGIIADGCRQLIVLDLAYVGTGRGPVTETTCSELVRRHPNVEVYTGGGIRGWDDVRRLETVGVAGALLSTSLHNGALSFRDASEKREGRNPSPKLR